MTTVLSEQRTRELAVAVSSLLAGLPRLKLEANLPFKLDLNEVEPVSTQRVVLHQHPDLDCMTAYWLARKFGQRAFPGIEHAELVFVPQGPPQNGRRADELMAGGELWLDCGEGMFDHHPHGKCIELCTTDLMARSLGVSNYRPLKRILTFVNLEDLEGPTSLSRGLRGKGIEEEICRKAAAYESFSLVSMIALMRSELEDDRELVEWTVKLLDLAFQQQHHFWNVAGPEFQRRADIFSIYTSGKTRRIATIESKKSSVGSFSRTREGGNCALCIHRHTPTGYVYISGSASSKEFTEIDKFLRVWEMQARGSVKTKYTAADLSSSKMPQCRQWYLPLNKYNQVFIVMNGSPKAKDLVEPTLLDTETIQLGVILGLYMADPEAKMPEECPGNFCLGKSCPFYPFFLDKCLQIRR